MSLSVANAIEPAYNPIDLLEEIGLANEWPFERGDDALMFLIRGRWCDYRLFFVWRDETGTLHLTCALDSRVADGTRREINDLLALVNDGMLMGHFGVCPDEQRPMFRHTLPMRGVLRASVEQLEDLVDIARDECDRCFPAFQYVSWGGWSASDAAATVMLDTVGEA